MCLKDCLFVLLPSFHTKWYWRDLSLFCLCAVAEINMRWYWPLSLKLVLSACFCRVSHEVVLACLKLVFSVCCCRISPEVVVVLATLKLVLSAPLTSMT